MNVVLDPIGRIADTRSDTTANVGNHGMNTNLNANPSIVK